MAPIIGALDKRALRDPVHYPDLALVDFDALNEKLQQFTFEREFGGLQSLRDLLRETVQ